MENYQIICKDIVDANWVEFLGYIKKQEAERKVKDQKRRLEAIARLSNNDYSESSKCVETEAGYFYPDLHSFWRWYMEFKIK